MSDRATKPKIDNSDESIVVEITTIPTLETLIDTLQELVSRLNVIASMANSGAPALRTISIGGTVTATGPITSAQSIAEKNVAGVMYTMRTANENITAIQSNINNVVVT